MKIAPDHVWVEEMCTTDTSIIRGPPWTGLGSLFNPVSRLGEKIEDDQYFTRFLTFLGSCPGLCTTHERFVIERNDNNNTGTGSDPTSLRTNVTCVPRVYFPPSLPPRTSSFPSNLTPRLLIPHTLLISFLISCSSNDQPLPRYYSYEMSLYITLGKHVVRDTVHDRLVV